MILLILLIVFLLLAVRVIWFMWRNRDLYFGLDNRHRFFAEKYKNFPILYNEYLAGDLKRKLFEPLQDVVSSDPELRRQKRIRILEIGAGAGANMGFYPANTNLVIVDPNRFYKNTLDENLAKHPSIKLEKYIVTGGENMKAIDNHSVDAVVSTIVLCSVDEIQECFKEICRILTPGGKFYFLEHVLDHKFSLVKILQHFFGCLGIWQFLHDGCRPDKNIEAELNQAEFKTVHTKRVTLILDEVPLWLWGMHILKPHLYGTATTSG